VSDLLIPDFKAVRMGAKLPGLNWWNSKEGNCNSQADGIPVHHHFICLVRKARVCLIYLSSFATIISFYLKDLLLIGFAFFVWNAVNVVH
jgi:hypothetical protein